MLAANCRAIAAAIVLLDLGEAPYAGVPCWTGAQRWARWTVPLAYDFRYDTDARPRMGGANRRGPRTLRRPRHRAGVGVFVGVVAGAGAVVAVGDLHWHTGGEVAAD